MFRDHPTEVRPRDRVVCLVASDRGSLTGLGAGETEPGVVVFRVPPSAFRAAGGEVPNVHGPCPSDLSDRVRQDLEDLHRRHGFDVIAIPAHRGLGFRTLQARDAGLSFHGVNLAVYLDTCSAWRREQEGRWPDVLEDLELDFIERRSFERADVQISCDSEVTAYVRSNGWKVRSDVMTVPGVTELGTFLLKTLLGEPPGLPRRDKPAGSLSSEDPPLVTVCVPHYNLGPHLHRTLESLGAQTYPHLEVLVIDDGSTDTDSREVFEAMRLRYPQFRFLTQPNAGIGATRNRGLAEARGNYFIPMDADNVARPELVERLVAGIHHRPELAALSCYFLAFEDDDYLDRGDFRFAYRPTGGPHVLSCLRNVYGDATAIYRTDAFRAVCGYETDRNTSFEDWEAYVKLVQAGFSVDVLPEYLCYYRHREAGFSRVTNSYANHERVLRQFRKLEALPEAERVALWKALVGFHRKTETLTARSRGLLHRVAEAAGAACRSVPFATPALKWLLRPLARDRNG